MNNPLVKILRLLVFVPVAILVLAFIYWVLGNIVNWLFNLGTIGIILAMIFFGGAIWGLIKMLAGYLVKFSSLLSPVSWFSVLLISILSVIYGGVLEYNIWSWKPDFTGGEIFSAIIGSILVFEMTIALIIGALAAYEEYY